MLAESTLLQNVSLPETQDAGGVSVHNWYYLYAEEAQFKPTVARHAPYWR